MDVGEHRSGPLCRWPFGDRRRWRGAVPPRLHLRRGRQPHRPRNSTPPTARSLIARGYKYPAAGQAAAAHAAEDDGDKPTGTTLYTYDYDAAGNTKRRTKAGADQTLAWDAEGNLASVTTPPARRPSYLYDVDGFADAPQGAERRPLSTCRAWRSGSNHQTRLDRRTRYYGLPGGAHTRPQGRRACVTSHRPPRDRSGDGRCELARRPPPDHPVRRGRGAPQPGAGQWPTEKGFVGGNQDSTTGLVNIGAREYDPITGRFISVDPIIDVNDPQQMHGYAYANNNPISFSDPDGLKVCSDDAVVPARTSSTCTATTTTSRATTTVAVAARGVRPGRADDQRAQQPECVGQTSRRRGTRRRPRRSGSARIAAGEGEDAQRREGAGEDPDG